MISAKNMNWGMEKWATFLALWLRKKIDKVVKVSGIENWNEAKTHVSTEYLGVDKYSNVFQEDWDYISAVTLKNIVLPVN